MANARINTVLKEPGNENDASTLQHKKKTNTRNSKQALTSRVEEELAQERRLYEEEIETYSGEDPLNPWCTYIKWIEQNYKGGREGNLVKVLQKCLLAFKHKECYYNDHRFIDIWLNYANFSKKPTDIFTSMSSRRIGVQYAKFYVCWAQDAEKNGNVKQASEILQKGLANNAKPTDIIKAYYNELKLQNSKNGTEFQSNQQFDTPLQIQQNKQTKLEDDMKENVNNQNDINDSARKLESSTKQKNSMLGKSEDHKIKKQQILATRTVEAISKNNCSTNSTNKPTQCRTILSKSKLWPPPIAHFESPDPFVKPMYQKTIIYDGTEELSFEEIMAKKWHEAQRKIEDERRRLQEENEKKELKDQVRQLKEKLQQLEMLVVHQNKDINNGNCFEDVNQPSATKIKTSAKTLSTSTCSSFSLPSLTVCTENSTQSVNSKKEDPTFLRELSNNCRVPSEQSADSVTVNQKLGNTYMSNEVNCMLRGLYNDTLSNNDGGNEFVGVNFDKNYEFGDVNKRSEQEALHSNSNFPLVSNILNDKEECKPKPFFIYKDPTEVLILPPFTKINDDNEVKAKGNNHEDLHTVSSVKNLNNEETSEIALKETALPNIDNKIVRSNNILACENLPFNEQSKAMEPLKDEYYKSEETYKDLWKDTMTIDFCRPLDNFTIITSEQFAAAARFASTPCIKSDVSGIRNKKNNETGTNEDNAKNMEYLETASIAELLQNYIVHADIKVQEILKQVLSFIDVKNSTKTVQETHNKAIEKLKLCKDLSKDDQFNNILGYCIMRLENNAHYDQYRSMNNQMIVAQLSTIMEASHESKSSSTSSGTSSIKQKPTQSACHSNSSKIIKNTNLENYEKLTVIQKSEYSINEQCKSRVTEEKTPTVGQKELFDYDMDVDPFDPEITSKLLETLATPISNYDKFYDCKDTSFHVKTGSSIQLGNIECELEHLHAEGAYAKVYFAQSTTSFINCSTFLPCPKLAVKVCKNANEWEFYACSELNNRIVKENIKPNIQDSILNIKTAASFDNCLVIVSDFFERGTLLDVVNVYKKQKTRVPEPLVMFFAIEMLHIISGIHKCGIVHADVKPDNFVLNDISATMDVNLMLEKPCFLRLIDFGRSIDLNLFKPGVTFSVVVKTDGFQCIQMKEERPWVFETDWYGVLCCIHILLFSEYMDVRKNDNDQWEPVQKFKRYFQVDIWQPLFQALLNIPSPYEVPDVTPFITMLSERLQKELKKLKSQMFQLIVTLMNKAR